MSYSNENELSQIKQLKKEGKFTEALKILNKLEEKKVPAIQEQLEIHHLKSTILFELGYMNKALAYAELAYKESEQLKDKSQMIDVLLTKISILNKSDERNEALKTISKAEQLLKKLNQKSSVEFERRKAYIALYRGGGYFNMGELNRSLKCADEVLTIAKKIKDKRLIMLAIKLHNFNNYFKGNLFHNLKSIEQYLALAEELNDKQEIIGGLNSIGMFFIEKGDFNKALGYLERALSLCDETNSFKTTVILSTLFEVYLRMNSLEKAQQCLDRMKELGDQTEFDPNGNFYRLSKAELLKKKPQKINHLKAKEILKQLIEEESPFSGLYYPALIDLCDLYLIDLHETNDLKNIEEIQPYLNQLKDIANDQQAYWLLVEVFSLEAKLKLITFEFNETKILLNKALDTAKKYGLNRLVQRITIEQYTLSKNFIRWEKMKISGANIAERMGLALIDEQIKRLLRKRIHFKSVNNQA
jgi:tetratricopeptide (TPR) repeat protein